MTNNTPTIPLSELSQYLAYGLKVKILNYKCDYVGIQYAEANGFYMLGNDYHVTYNGGSAGKSINEFKPIVRPLTDVEKVMHGEFYPELINEIQMKALPLTTAMHLFENHIDVFGWLEAGLAINIHDIEK